MDLKLVEYLQLVCEYGSFSKASPVIGMAQPALGRQIEKLEKECGTRLLYRHGRGVTLTPEGERFLQAMRPMMRQMEEIIGSLQGTRERPQGAVTVGLTPTMRDLFGLLLVTTMRNKYPDVQLSIVSGYSGYVHEWLNNGSLDIALVHDACRSRHIAVDLLGRARLYLVSPASGPLALAKPQHGISLEEVSTLPLALPTRKHGLRRTLETACRDIGASLRVEYEMDTLSLMKELVLGGHAHTVLAIPAIQRELMRGEVVARPLQAPHVDTSIMLATATNRPYTSAIRVVQEEILFAMKQAVLGAPLAMDISFA